VRLAKLRNFVDELKLEIQPDASEGPGALGEVISCSLEMKAVKNRGLGITPLRWAILRAAGFDQTVK
jgi:GTP-binding protein